MIHSFNFTQNCYESLNNPAVKHKPVAMDDKIFECVNTSARAAKAIARIQVKKYDYESWKFLLNEAGQKPIEDVEPFYEALLQTFPTRELFWRKYIQHEMEFKRYDKVSKLFQRCLEEILSVDLYKCYLNFVREVKANEPDLIVKAYSYSLDRVGYDPNAMSIYKDYINFLKERETDGQYLESQKLLAIRKTYIEGTAIPMIGVDKLWDDYMRFENSISVNMADKTRTNRGRDREVVQDLAKVLKSKIEDIDRSWPACPPTLSPRETRQIELWRRYIQWEKSNPARPEWDNQTLVKRVSYAYKQYILSFGHHPNVWHEFATWLNETSKNSTDKEPELAKKLLKEQAILFERAIKGFMKKNSLIHFTYSDFEETKNDKRKALEIYNHLIDSRKEDNESDLTLAYIQLMRFTRRTEGLKAARLIFKRAREEQNCDHHLYTAAALMEYHCAKDHSISCKIFELGLKKFSSCPDYILSYIHFMTSLNEENNTRVLYERVLTTCNLQPHETIEIWNNFIEFETALGDMSSINKIERRRQAALEQTLPQSTGTSWAIDKYRFRDLFPCSQTELQSLNYDPQQCATQVLSTVQLMSSIGSGGQNNDGKQLSQASSKRLKSLGRGASSGVTNGTEPSAGDQDDWDQSFGNAILENTSFMCLPDLDQMLPFKPVVSTNYGDHSIPGGVFPPPPAVGNLLSRLPQTFWGPYVDIVELCEIIQTTNFDELFKNLVEHRRDNSRPRGKRQRTD